MVTLQHGRRRAEFRMPLRRLGSRTEFVDAIAELAGTFFDEAVGVLGKSAPPDADANDDGTIEHAKLPRLDVSAESLVTPRPAAGSSNNNGQAADLIGPPAQPQAHTFTAAPEFKPRERPTDLEKSGGGGVGTARSPTLSGQTTNTVQIPRTARNMAIVAAVLARMRKEALHNACR